MTHVQRTFGAQINSRPLHSYLLFPRNIQLSKRRKNRPHQVYTKLKKKREAKKTGTAPWGEKTPVKLVVLEKMIGNSYVFLLFFGIFGSKKKL